MSKSHFVSLYRQERSPKKPLQPRSRTNPHRELVILTAHPNYPHSQMTSSLLQFRRRLQRRRWRFPPDGLPWITRGDRRTRTIARGGVERTTHPCRRTIRRLDGEVQGSSSNPSQPVLRPTLALRRDLRERKNRHCKVGLMISKRTAFTCVKFAHHIPDSTKLSTGRTSETRLHREIASSRRS